MPGTERPPLNIWYISAYDQPEGFSSRTYDYAMELCRLGHSVTMFTNSYCHFTHKERLAKNEEWRLELYGPLRVIWMKTIPYVGNGWRRGANMVSNAVQIQRIGGRLAPPDIVIGPSVPLLTGLSAYLLSKRKKSVFIFEVRDIWPQALVDLGYFGKKNVIYFVLRMMEKYLYARAARISAVLPLTGEHVRDSGQDPRKVVWLPNGINLDRFAGLPPYDGGEAGKLRVMYIGGFSTAHDVMTIIKAASILSRNDSGGIEFVIAGQGEGRAACVAEAERMKLTNVAFHEPVPKKNVPEFQLRADLLISSVKDMPVYQFGINSNKIYDYLASGRPIIFAGKAPNDPVKESGGGLSISSEDPERMAEAILRFFHMHPRERKKIGSRSRAYAENQLDIKVLARRYEAMLFDAIRERRHD